MSKTARVASAGIAWCVFVAVWYFYGAINVIALASISCVLQLGRLRQLLEKLCDEEEG